MSTKSKLRAKQRAQERVERKLKRKTERAEPKKHECVWRVTRLDMRECVTTRTLRGCYDLQ
ncbi:MAG: hypothetical protein L0Z53_06600 [Acidobacteriales bacterium]|nr:hypothetical protein [Terriglobales bacterium]